MGGSHLNAGLETWEFALYHCHIYFILPPPEDIAFYLLESDDSLRK